MQTQVGLDMRPRRTNKGSVVVLLVSALGVVPGSQVGLAADEDDPPRSRYPERLVYDPSTREWMTEEPPEPGTPDGDLALARNLLARGEHKKASKRLTQWIRRYAFESPRHPEAVFLLGRAEFEMGNFIRAHRRYQQVLNTWPGTEWAEEALRGDFVIAEVFLAGHRRKILGIPLFKAYDEALDILDDIVVNHPRTALAEHALKTKADYYFRTGEFALAEDTYAQLARDYPAGRYVREAMLQSARAALASFPGVEFDDAPLVEAEERFLQFREAFSQSGDDEDVSLTLESIQAKRAEKEFAIARYYERVKQYEAAVYYYHLVEQGWPDTTWARLAGARLTRFGWTVDDEFQDLQEPRTETASDSSVSSQYDEP